MLLLKFLTLFPSRPSFYGFVSDNNAKTLLFEERMWLLRFRDHKFVLTVSIQGESGLEHKDYEICFKNEKYYLDGEELPKLENLLTIYEVNDMCAGSPYVSASHMASTNNYDYYDWGSEIPFRNVWCEQLSDEA